MTKFTVSLLVLGSVLLSSPVLAHDELVSTSPLAGSTVEAGAIPIRLTFGEAPMKMHFGQGNLIAVARMDTLEQLGPACANVEDNMIYTTVNLATPGEYKVLWRVVSEDGHVNTGDFVFTVQNNIYYTTDNPGNQCFDENGVPLTTSEILSVKKQPTDGMIEGLLWGLGATFLGAMGGALMVRRRQSS